MSRKVFLTCAVTGNAPFNPKHPNFPVTPKEIAAAAIEAANAGASAVHLHVRDEKTRLGSRDPALFKEVVDRIRQAGTDIVINLTCGHGAFFYPDPEDESRALPESDVANLEDRIAHLIECRPEIASIDVTTGNQVEGPVEFVYLNTTRMLRQMAEKFIEYDIKPEIEVFEAGDVMFLNQLIKEDRLVAPYLIQMVLGVQWASPPDAETILYLRNMLPDNAYWTAMGIAQMQMPMVAQSIAMGGNVRVGLEDNLYLRRGEFATNGQLVERAATMVDILGHEVATPQEMRDALGLKNHS